MARDGALRRQKLLLPKGGKQLKKLKVGLVGTGFVTDLHIEAYKKVIGVPIEVAGVVSRSREKAEKFAQQHGIARVYSDYRQMLDDKEIDMVDVCYPNR